ncbi:MAG: hypothetical protein V4487_06140 [Chlamydiota bacterium]
MYSISELNSLFSIRKKIEEVNGDSNKVIYYYYDDDRFNIEIGKNSIFDRIFRVVMYCIESVRFYFIPEDCSLHKYENKISNIVLKLSEHVKNTLQELRNPDMDYFEESKEIEFEYGQIVESLSNLRKSFVSFDSKEMEDKFIETIKDVNEQIQFIKFPVNPDLDDFDDSNSISEPIQISCRRRPNLIPAQQLFP